MARAKPTNQLIPRSFRIDQGTWERAKQRAATEDTSVSAAVSDLLEGYARGVYDLPRRTVTKRFPDKP